MARNRFDVDETLETPFNIKHLLRAGVYIKRHKQKMILSLVFSAISAACALVGPKLIETALNVAVPNRDYKMLFILAGIMLLSILLSIFRQALTLHDGGGAGHHLRHPQGSL